MILSLLRVKIIRIEQTLMVDGGKNYKPVGRYSYDVLRGDYFVITGWLMHNGGVSTKVLLYKYGDEARKGFINLVLLFLMSISIQEIIWNVLSSWSFQFYNYLSSVHCPVHPIILVWGLATAREQWLTFYRLNWKHWVLSHFSVCSYWC